jgi:hypothetical protein
MDPTANMKSITTAHLSRLYAPIRRKFLLAKPTSREATSRSDTQVAARLAGSTQRGGSKELPLESL